MPEMKTVYTGYFVVYLLAILSPWLRMFCASYLTLTLPGPSAGVSGSLDSYCSLKPLCSGMGEVVPACTSPTLLPHPLALCCHYPVSKCCSASIAVTSTVRVKSCVGSEVVIGVMSHFDTS